MQTEICVLKNLQATQIAHTHVSQEENYVLSATFLYDGIGVSDQGLPPAYWSSSPAKVAYSRLKLAFFQQPTSICARKRHDKQHVNHIQQLILRIFCSHQDCPWQAKFCGCNPKLHAAQRHCGRGWARNQNRMPNPEPTAIVSPGPSTEVLPVLLTSFLMIIRRGA